MRLADCWMNGCGWARATERHATEGVQRGSRHRRHAVLDDRSWELEYESGANQILCIWLWIFFFFFLFTFSYLCHPHHRRALS
jgi:hypothetical protein